QLLFILHFSTQNNIMKEAILKVKSTENQLNVLLDQLKANYSNEFEEINKYVNCSSSRLYGEKCAELMQVNLELLNSIEIMYKTPLPKTLENKIRLNKTLTNCTNAIKNFGNQTTLDDAIINKYIALYNYSYHSFKQYTLINTFTQLKPDIKQVDRPPPRTASIPKGIVFQRYKTQ
ncbi:hypothetical protein MN116_008108, partial [Schistosoma mekongi]